MAIQVHYIEEFNLVESVFGEEYTLQEVKDSTSEGLVIATEKGTNRFLVDLSNMTHSRSILDVYSIGDMFSSMDIKRGIRQAVILSKKTSAQKNTFFYETALRNRGFDVKVFKDRIEAIAWLLQD